MELQSLSALFPPSCSLQFACILTTTQPFRLFTRTYSSTMSNANKYELLYWPGIRTSIPPLRLFTLLTSTPAGRGEFARLAFEATKTPYLDVSNQVEGGIHQVLAVKGDKATHDANGNPPAFAPPALRIHGEGKNGKSLVLSQTPAILVSSPYIRQIESRKTLTRAAQAFLGEKLDLAGADAAEKAWIQALALTALDLNNETHDTHHPVSTLAYYEDQKPESLRKAADLRETRIPKFFGYFERVLKGNKEGKGKYLVGDKLRYVGAWRERDSGVRC